MDAAAPTCPILILALPRSGSTLLQRLLAAHPDIATAPEPWLALAPAYALRDGVHAEYGHRTAARALDEFTARLPGGRARYHQEAGRFLTALYTAAAGGKAFFVDKTPRYHLIADALAQMLPRARFVVLTRHPLAVVASVARTWNDGRLRLGSNAVDVFDGPGALAAFARRTDVAVRHLRYEDLVTRPEPTLAALGDFLGLTGAGAWATLAHAGLIGGALGDRVGQARYGTRVESGPAQGWQSFYDSTLRRRFAARYLATLGEDTLRALGYDAELPWSSDRPGAPVGHRSGTWPGARLVRDVLDLRGALPGLLAAGPWRYVRARGRGARRAYRLVRRPE